VSEVVSIVVSVGVAILGGGIFIGIAALYKAVKEAPKVEAETAHELVATSGEVIKQLREHMDAMDSAQDEDRARIEKLEHAVVAWETWADKMTALLDRAVGLMSTEHAAGMADDIAEVKANRPTRYRT
jgi:uncharacterized protein YneF (UPF0154 family)